MGEFIRKNFLGGGIRSGILVAFVLLFMLASCIERFAPETLNYENMLFIEAYLTNHQDDIPFVKISGALSVEDDSQMETMSEYQNQRFAYLFDGEKYIAYYYGNEIILPEGAADVRISSSDGTDWVFSEVYTGTGVYFEDSGTLRGESGKSYKLLITTIDGNVYESEYEMLSSSPPIEDISYVARSEKIDNFGRSAYGYRFNVSTNGVADETSYFRWDLEETFEYEAQVEAHFLSLGGQKKRDYSNEEIWFCYKTSDLKGVYIENTSSFADNRLSNKTLNFVNQYGYQLSSRYSLRVKQLSITKSAYNFWNDVNQTTTGNEGLYAAQPYKLEGNIRCISDSNKKIIGIFEVAGTSEDRIFVNRPVEFDILIESCPMDTLTTYDDWLGVEDGDYLTYVEGLNIFLTAPRICYDCRLRGGTTAVPEFWIFDD